MRYSSIWIIGALLALTSCGGGGGGGTTGPVIPPAPPATGTPTAVITNSSSTAGNLAKAGSSGVGALLSTSSLNGANLPFFSNISTPIMSPPAKLAGVTASTVITCNIHGTMAISYTVTDPNVLTTGDNAMIGFNNCAFTPDPTINGSLTMLIARYVSTTNFAVTLQATNFTSTVGGVVDGPYNFIGTVDYNNNVVTYSYNVNGVTVVGQPVVVYTSTQTNITSGTVRVFYANGWLEATYNNWVIDTATGKPVSGMLTLTDANGDTAVVTVVGTDYVVDIIINGTHTVYTVPI